jgi:sarcosine oxidase, subunit alpha
MAQTEWPHMKVYFTSVTDHWAVMSVAGPDSRKVVEAVCEGIDFTFESFPSCRCAKGLRPGLPARVFRISFSGELAYEINVPANHGRQVWDAVMQPVRSTTSRPMVPRPCTCCVLKRASSSWDRIPTAR